MHYLPSDRSDDPELTTPVPDVISMQNRFRTSSRGTRLPFRRASSASSPRRLAILGLGALAPVVLSGCNIFMIAAYLISGPPSVEPDFEAATRTSLSDKDATVAVACYVPIDLRADIGNESLDKEIARMVTQRLTYNKIKVRDPSAVRQWIARNPDWVEPGEIAEAMQVS
ncbi:MAG: hypothetical protein AAF907_17765, partial [Planctomycetota bacterium]